MSIKTVLTKDHLRRMKVPKRFWSVTFDGILPNNSIHKDSIKNYLSNLDKRLKDGYGLFLWGDNGTGKTSCAIVIAKEVRRMGKLVLFTRSTVLRDGIINKEDFDDGNSLLDRARDVDLLVIDDLGKEYLRNNSSYNETLYEDLLRWRIDEIKPTIITSNLSVVDLRKSYYKESMIKLMESYYAAVRIKGHDYFANIAKEAGKSVTKG